MRQKNEIRSLLRYRGAVGFSDKVLTSELPTHLAACLRNAGAWEVTVSGDRVVFTGSGMGPVLSFKWPVLAPFGCGELEVDSACRQVRYSLRLAHLIALGCVVVCGMAVFGLAVGMPKVMMIVFLPIVWTWVVGARIWIGSRAFTGFLRGAISQTPGNQGTDPNGTSISPMLY
jgi:hypothetical protein